MSQLEKAQQFKALHVKGNPLVLYNIWDAGSAASIAKAGANAVATGSWSVAVAQGYPDGEAIPLDFLLSIVERIAATVDLPLSVDFEGAYAEDPATIQKNVSRLIAAGAVGLNFEDQKVGGSGLHEVAAQAERVKAVRRAADEAGIPLVINARTDLFLKEKDGSVHASLIEEAMTRQSAYAAAGADCFFVPGLTDKALITDVCERSELPVNAILLGDLKAVQDVVPLGVSRVSFGPGPYRVAGKDLVERFSAI